MHVCDNVGDHLIGNVYARFDWEDEAGKAVEELNKRWFNGASLPSSSLALSLLVKRKARIDEYSKIAGRPLYAELSPVTDFREACCKQNDMGSCDRGGFCNFSASPFLPLHQSLPTNPRLAYSASPPPLPPPPPRTSTSTTARAEGEPGPEG